MNKAATAYCDDGDERHKVEASRQKRQGGQYVAGNEGLHSYDSYVRVYDRIFIFYRFSTVAPD
jgi:hypothetical protein